MDSEQKTALENYFRTLCGGEQSLLSALAFAASLSPEGKLSADFWREIAGEETQTAG